MSEIIEAKTKQVGIEEFTEIPVLLPPILMKMIGYLNNARYVALYYYGSKATWDDGLSLATFSYYSVYEPLKSHPVMAVHLFEAHLGSDDEYPTHALLCDREGRKFYVGGYDQVLTFLRQQHPEKLTEEYLAEYRAVVEREAPATVREMRDIGMFEFLFAPDANAQRETATLRAWLDGQITEALVRKLADALAGGEMRAYEPLSYIKELCRKIIAEQQRGAGGQMAGDPEPQVDAETGREETFS